MGPGIAESLAGLPLEQHRSSAAFGSVFRRLGSELSTGHIHDWHGKDATPAGMPNFCRGAIAVLHVAWRQCKGGLQWPARLLKRVDVLRSAAADLVAAVLYLRELFLGKARSSLPIALVGMSFGGPAAWAAAAELLRNGLRLDGVVALAASGRGGAAFETLNLDTRGCVEACAAAGIPTLFLHGSADKNVALDVAAYFYRIYCRWSHRCEDLDENASAVARHASFVVVPGSVHNFSNARDRVFLVLKDWLVECLAGGNRKRSYTTSASSSIEALAVVWDPTMGKSKFEACNVPIVQREALLAASVKGYSEKDLELTELVGRRRSEGHASDFELSYATADECS